MAGERRLSLQVVLHDQVRPTLHKLFPEEFRENPQKLYELLFEQSKKSSQNFTEDWNIQFRVKKFWLDLECQRNKANELRRDFKMENHRSGNIFNCVSVAYSISIIKKIFSSIYEEHKKQLEDLLHVTNETNAKPDSNIPAEKYEQLFEMVKRILMEFDVGVDHLEVEKMHVEFNHRRSLYWILQDYVRPVLQKIYPNHYEESNTLRETYNKLSKSQIIKAGDDCCIFIEIFKKIDDPNEIMENEYKELFRKAKMLYKFTFPRLPNQIDTIDMEIIKCDKYMRELILQSQHTLQSFIPKKSRTKESLLGELSDNLLFDEDMVQEIIEMNKDKSDEDFMSSSLIPKIIEKYFILTDENKKRWEHLQVARYQIISTIGTWKTVSKVDYKELKEKLTKACICSKKKKCMWKPDKEERPTLYFYNMLNQCLMVEGKKVIEVSEDEYVLWKNYIEKFESELSDGDNKVLEVQVEKLNQYNEETTKNIFDIEIEMNKKTLKQYKKRTMEKYPFAAISLSKDFGMFKMLYTINCSENSDPLTSPIKDLLNDINEDFANSKYDVMSSNKKERNTNLENLLKELLLEIQGPSKNVMDSKKLFNYYVESLVKECSEFLNVPKDKTSSYVEIRQIPDRIKCLLRSIMGPLNVVKLTTISHGMIRNPDPNNATITKYHAPNINSVTLYPPWGSELSSSAAAEILCEMLKSDAADPSKMYYKTKFGKRNECIFKYNTTSSVNVDDITTYNTIRKDKTEESGQVPDIHFAAVNKYDNIYSTTKDLIDIFKRKAIPETHGIIFDILSETMQFYPISSDRLYISLEKFLKLLSKFIERLCLENRNIELHCICCLQYIKQNDKFSTFPPNQYYYTQPVDNVIMKSKRSLDSIKRDIDELPDI